LDGLQILVPVSFGKWLLQPEIPKQDGFDSRPANVGIIRARLFDGPLTRSIFCGDFLVLIDVNEWNNNA
jgi:hypothetical protein